MSEDQEYKGAWATTEFHCRYCGYSSVNVYPVVAVEIECPHCHIMNTAPELDVEQLEFVEKLEADLAKLPPKKSDAPDDVIVESVMRSLKSYVYRLSKKHPLTGAPALSFQEYEGYVRMNLTLDFALIDDDPAPTVLPATAKKEGE